MPMLGGKNTRTILLILVAAIGVVALAYAFLARSDAPGAVRIATFSNAVDYAPFYIARDQGFFEEELAKIGATAEYSTFDALAPLNDALAAERLDFVFEAEPPAFIAEASGVDVEIVFLSVTLEQNIIARAGGPITRVEDLAGRNVGVLTGTSSHYGMIDALVEAGVDPDTVTFTNLPPPEGRAAFRSGAIDAWAVWPPFPEVEEGEGRAVEVPGTEAIIHSLLIARSEYSAENASVVDALVTALRRAQAFIAQNPADAQAIVARAVDLPAAVIARAWPKHNFQPRENAAFTADLQAKADFLYENEFIDTRVEVGRDLLSQE